MSPDPDPAFDENYVAAFVFRVRAACLPRTAEPERFLKQAGHRASRRCLKDGARSSLRGYLQTRFSVLDAARDGRRGAFLAFAV
jgi:hypothetical protein